MTRTIARRLQYVLFLSLMALPCTARAETAGRKARIERLENMVLSPCCYAEPVARHQSEVAIKMRLEIQNWVNTGKTDQEILAAYKDRYGERVLAPPPRDVRMWTDGIPWILTLLGGAGVVWLLARWRVKAASGPVPAGGPSLPSVPESDEDWERFNLR
ncbi:MAG: cytochrome c-type biogenesis protein CcmH [Bryobacterales bacterium]|nr:cytochrome c-type biogenesis protein CcmH [Bryobacterales bacterium]MEB2364403.1 cytochrome c-type biogenesis protein CcmH [Bryobacterales bacterium]